MFLSLTRKRFRVNDMLGVYCEIRFIAVLEMIGEIRVWGVKRHLQKSLKCEGFTGIDRTQSNGAE